MYFQASRTEDGIMIGGREKRYQGEIIEIFREQTIAMETPVWHSGTGLAIESADSKR